jgi:segregation and condensation protein A
MEPKPVLELSLAHIHAPTVSVREQAAIVVERLRRQKAMTFRALSGDAPDMLTRVARFLSLLELFREGAVAFDQVSPLGELTVRWTGAEEGEVTITDEFDGSPEEGEETTTYGSPPEEEDRGPDDPGDDPVDDPADDPVDDAVDDPVDDAVEDAAKVAEEDAVEDAAEEPAGAFDGAEAQKREPE